MSGDEGDGGREEEGGGDGSGWVGSDGEGGRREERESLWRG
jgi:hypothetical protein